MGSVWKFSERRAKAFGRTRFHDTPPLLGKTPQVGAVHGYFSSTQSLYYFAEKGHALDNLINSIKRADDRSRS